MIGNDPFTWRPAAALVPVGSFAIALVLGYWSLTKRREHPRIITACIAIPLLVALRNARDASPSLDFNSFYAFTTLIGLAHICYLHCFLSITRLIPEHDGDRQWLLAYKLLFNLRITPAAATNLCYRMIQRKREDHITPQPGNSTVVIPSRLTFVSWLVLSILGKYLVLCLLYDPLLDPSQMAPGDAEWRPIDFAPDRQIVFRRAIYLAAHRMGFPFCRAEIGTDTTTIIRGAIIRVQFLVQPMLYDFCSLGAFHDALAAIAVGIGLDTPGEWPPLFGDIGEVYTVRRFWSCFWQRLIYNSFSAFTGVFSDRVLHLRKGTLLARYVKNALVFVLSGVMHGIAIRSIHPSCPAHGAILFFSMQIGAIFAEETLFLLWRMASKNRRVKHRHWSLTTRLLGYIWVTSWLCYSMAFKLFPQIRCLDPIEE